MPVPYLRPVMDAEQYQRERQKIRDLYGADADSAEQPAAKRDQALADLFARSEWTQVELAEAEGKSQSWVVCRLRLGRFLAYATSITPVISIVGLTEGRFRSYWEQTNKSADEIARFDAVIRLMQEPKPTPQPQPQPQAELKPKREIPSPQRDKAREIVRPLVEAGQPTPPDKLHKEHGLAEISFREATAYERGRLEGIAEAKAADALIDASILSVSQQAKFAALEKRLRARLTAAFDVHVQQWVSYHIEDTLLPIYGEKLRKAEMLMKHGKPFTNSEFRDILGALHPDCIDAERRNRAFRLVKEKEVVLRPEEKDRPYTSNLPSKEELLARMKAKMEARQKAGRKT